ncbi:hypothetical protein GCM10022211_25220 [Sphingomonas humi]|uniref:Uncharacterized protein n=1 Tax=Sphingomonas humi TaxID=335630 RepID=A0ABP7SCL1_9SPHN
MAGASFGGKMKRPIAERNWKVSTIIAIKVAQPINREDRPNRPAMSVATTDTPKITAMRERAMRMLREFCTPLYRFTGQNGSIARAMGRKEVWRAPSPISSSAPDWRLDLDQGDKGDRWEKCL